MFLASVVNQSVCVHSFIYFSRNLLDSLLFMNHLANFEHVVQKADTNKS